jgi:hypothetical protein
MSMIINKEKQHRDLDKDFLFFKCSKLIVFASKLQIINLRMMNKSIVHDQHEFRSRKCVAFKQNFFLQKSFKSCLSY